MNDGLVLRAIAAITAAFGIAVSFVWAVATGAKKCATKASEKAERMDAVAEGIQREMTGIRTDMQKGFDRVHERLDQHFGA